MDKEACPGCGSNDWMKDNLRTFPNGTKHCFACNYHEGSMTKIDQINQEIEEDKELMEGTYTNLRDRAISLETCEAYGYQTYVTSANVEVHIAEHRDRNTGEVVSQQLRYPNKSFPWINPNKDLMLFGQHLATDYTKPIYITEGQIDAMSIHEASNGTVQAVSIPKGINDAHNALLNNMEELKKYSNIILFFDNDDAGHKGLEKCKTLLPMGKASYINNYNMLAEKDANELLTIGGPEILLEVLETHLKEIVPDGIVYGDDIDYETLLVPESVGINLPYPALTDAIRGIKPGRLYMIGAGTGVGKTSFLKEVIYHWKIKHPKFRVSHIFLEENQKQTLQSYIAMHCNVRTFQFAENPNIVSRQQFLEAVKLLNNRQNIFLDHFGSLDSNKLLQKLEYLASKSDVIILDHISIAISGNTSSREGERKDIDILMTKLRELIAKTGVSVITVSHLTRPQGEGFEEGRPVTLNSFRGSGTLTNVPDVVLSLERDTQNPAERDKTTIRILKNRITGLLGPVIVPSGEKETLYFVSETGRIVTSAHYLGNL